MLVINCGIFQGGYERNIMLWILLLWKASRRKHYVISQIRYKRRFSAQPDIWYIYIALIPDILLYIWYIWHITLCLICYVVSDILKILGIISFFVAPQAQWLTEPFCGVIDEIISVALKTGNYPTQRSCLFFSL